jgi:hypothetical protein
MNVHSLDDPADRTAPPAVRTASARVARAFDIGDRSTSERLLHPDASLTLRSPDAPWCFVRGADSVCATVRNVWQGTRWARHLGSVMVTSLADERVACDSYVLYLDTSADAAAVKGYGLQRETFVADSGRWLLIHSDITVYGCSLAAVERNEVARTAERVPAVGPTSASDLERLMSRMADHRWVVDFRRSDRIAEFYIDESITCIQPSGVLVEGRAATDQFYDAQWSVAATPTGWFLHFVGSPAIEMAGDGTARCATYALYPAWDGTVVTMRGFAAYIDMWVDDPVHGWRVARRDVTLGGRLLPVLDGAGNGDATPAEHAVSVSTCTRFAWDSARWERSGDDHPHDFQHLGTVDVTDGAPGTAAQVQFNRLQVIVASDGTTRLGEVVRETDRILR